MAIGTAPPPIGEASDNSLRSRLAAALPRDQRFTLFHLSTPPTKTDALCSPPPGERSERTYCERHFLAVSASVPAEAHAHANPPPAAAPRQVLVLGIEVYVFTTARTTTIFVSKADSTGYLHLLDGRPAVSPVRAIAAAFVAFLADHRRRPTARLVVSLFARAQGQYLFPGSSSNPGKHVLDDRGLVRWWCRVLDGVLLAEPRARGYLVVPGLDAHETRACLPRSNGSQAASVSGRWMLEDPLERISPYTGEFDWVPPRCLIPRFPDDPKSRFRDELDEEAGQSSQFRITGSWKSVRTLSTFWEMMEFRQECSSGRMTGFIWLVLDDLDDEKDQQTGAAQLSSENPAGAPSQATTTTTTSSNTPSTSTPPQTPKKQRTLSNIAPNTTPRKLFRSSGDVAIPLEEKLKADSQRDRKKRRQKKKKLRGPIRARRPHVKKAQRNYLLDKPVTTAYYAWTPGGRGERIVDETDYKRIVELLLHLDFATLDKAVGSTRRWIGEVGMGAGWGYAVQGTKEPDPRPAAPATTASEVSVLTATQPRTNGQQVNNLTGLVKRKRSEAVAQPAGAEASSTNAAEPANVLSQGLIRKKPKV
jgi:regulator of Ty1 transposition protein 109